MMQFVFYLLSAMVGFVAALIVFPQNKEVHRFMTHQINNTDRYYDLVYRKR